MNCLSSDLNDSYSIDTSIVVVPVRSSYCQTETALQTKHVHLDKSEKTINLREDLTERLYHGLHVPLVFTNREVLDGKARALFYPNKTLGMKNRISCD